ncbi:MAG: glycosyltransferase [Betaproteobacteria bacterium]|nr:glycosyltransferase [Betaproteobacteria bacterium]MDH5220469.1 glycosyltransferase [Betaproteobacteria bacterium]MDH5350170.1 glycosyltransferase [Betaproteobacteria bacterium]
MSGPRVAVISPNRGAPSETFIRAHIERLPLPTTAIYGGGWRRFTGSGPIWPLLRYPGRALGLIAPAAAGRLYARALAAKLKALGADVALAEYGTTGAEVLDACVEAHLPLVVYFYGFDAWREPIARRYRPAYERMFREAQAIVAVSRSIRDLLEAWGAPREKLHHVVCGADQAAFQGATPAEAPPHFLAVGRFVDKKAPQLTVSAFRDAHAVEPAATLTMVGDGPLLEHTRRHAASLGLQDAISFPGVLAPKEVIGLMRNARAFVQHSVAAADGDREGTPVALLEAQMAGLPVVSTRHSGIPEIVADGETGILVDERDAAAMGRAMARLAQDPGLADAMGKAARQRALAHFSQRRTLAQLAEILTRAAQS